MARKDGIKRRTQIIETAQTLFYTKGYESTSVNDVIRSVGVSKGAFYHHFNSKQAVLTSVVNDLAKQTYQLIQPILNQGDLNALEKLNQITQTANNWKIEQRDQILAIAKVMYSDGNLRLRHQLLTETNRVILPIWTQVIKQGVGEGVFELKGIDETYAAEFILTILSTSGESFIQLLLDPNRPANSVNIAIERYTAAQTAIERILGAPSESLSLIGPDDISSWFV